ATMSAFGGLGTSVSFVPLKSKTRVGGLYSPGLAKMRASPSGSVAVWQRRCWAVGDVELLAVDLGESRPRGPLAYGCVIDGIRPGRAGRKYLAVRAQNHRSDFAVAVNDVDRGLARALPRARRRR